MINYSYCLFLLNELSLTSPILSWLNCDILLKIKIVQIISCIYSEESCPLKEGPKKTPNPNDRLTECEHMNQLYECLKH